MALVSELIVGLKEILMKESFMKFMDLISGYKGWEKGEEERSMLHAYQVEREQAQYRKRQEYEAYQDSLHQQILGYVSDSNTILKNLPVQIDIAENALNEAETEFKERAFAPFWDAVETAATRLAIFNFGIQQIKDNAINYMEEKKKLDSTPPRFQINIGTLPIATRTSDRMRRIVRRAQKDFQFSTIYEQRKTNKLLVEGFSSLGQALNEMTCRITTSIEALFNSIRDLASSNRESSKELLAGVESLLNQMHSDAETSRDHNREERKMLDNIQRGKKPLF
ncbi:MAG: hypothetical protein C4560_06700 [Nitrospiraceae bacterium]|nr:MAG: hypothetical protein C4560_06700 [Nitrospiraceae bacterium]